jgi:predicted PolB exonuclease-like 3'-5' exonuclease
MSYTNDNKWMAFDIETAGREDVSGYIPEPQADKRLSDPVKVKADLEKKRAESVDRLPLDPNGCRIVSVGWQVEGWDSPEVLSEPAGEQFMLETFWKHAKGRRLVGYYSRLFDLPVILQRSRLLGVSIPDWRNLLAPYGRARGHVDLFDELTFDNGRADGVIPRKLTTFCKQFGIDIPEDDSAGSDMAALVKAGDWEAIRQHCSRDVERTVALARRLGIVPAPVEASVF